MGERHFEVTYTITKTVRVRVPDDLLESPPYGTHEDAAEEFALGGRDSWPEYVLGTSEDYDVESVQEISIKATHP